MKDFEVNDKRERNYSGIEGQFGEAEELPSLMKKARDDKEEKEKRILQELKEADDAKIRAGEQMFGNGYFSCCNRKKRSGASLVDSNVEEHEQQGKTKRKRVAKARDEAFAGEMERYEKCATGI